MSSRTYRVELVNYVWYSDDNNSTWKLGYLQSSLLPPPPSSSSLITSDDEMITIFELSATDVSNLINDCIDRIKIDKNAKTITVAKRSVHSVDPSHFMDLYDLCFMNNLHEAPLVDVLRRRFLSSDIYTSCGDVLISVNPYQHIEGLYDNPMRFLSSVKKVYGSRASVASLQCVPHVYQIANNTLRDLMNSFVIDDVGNIQVKKVNQSILISGESGAGKTEASKQVMNFLVLANDEIMERRAVNSLAGGQTFRSGSQIKDAILESNVIFEAFGNAKTVRNDNSSRFGKYIKLVYDEEDVLISAFSETFLLESSRLIVAGKDERNYHIFYQLCRGLPLMNAEQANRLQLLAPENFKILNIGECTTIKSPDDDISEFQNLWKAMTTLGFDYTEIDALCIILAIILHLGNVSCYPGADESQMCIISSKSMSTSQISELLGVQEDVFVSAILTHKMIIARRSVQVKILSSVDANNNISAIIKWVYGCIFKWIVLKINEANAFDGDASHKYIGILDIFGFETLIVNSFEQLCINFANERLQKLFNEEVFDLEQQYYATNGLIWTEITYKDNQDVIDLISRKPTGLFHLLEQQALMNRKPDDVALLNNFNNTHTGKNSAYRKSKFGNDNFTIVHFAGTVNYLIDGFIMKNNDSLHDDMVMVLMGTTNNVLSNIINYDSEQLPMERESLSRKSVMFNKSSLKHINSELDGIVLASKKGSPMKGDSSRASVSVKSPTTNSGKMASALTVSVKFRSQVDVLLSDLYNTKPHYIKCIKSNSRKLSNEFDIQLVLEQLRYSGALEVVRIRREGYPVNFSFKDFYYEYELLTDRLKNISDENIKRTAAKIANKYLSSEEYQVGYERIFLRSSYEETMSQAMSKMFSKTATLIQTRMRIKLARNMKRVIIVSFLFIQRAVRGYFARKRVRVLRKLYNKSQTIITAIIRSFIYNRRYKLTLKRVIIVQARIRGFVTRIENSKWRRQLVQKCHLLITTSVRGMLARKVATIRKNALLKIQSLGRMIYAVKRYKEAVAAIILLQSTIRGFIAKTQVKLVNLIYTGVVKLQANFRMNQARKKYEEALFHIICIQATIRKYITMKNVSKLIRAVVLIQMKGRSFLITKRCKEDRRMQCITKIQAFCRMLSEHKKFSRIIFSAITIENVVRMFLSKRHYQGLLIIRDNVRAKCSLVLKRSLSLFIMKMRIHLLHKNCESGNALYIASLLKKYDYKNVRNRYNLFCTIHHSISRAGLLAVEILKTVGLSAKDVYSIDSNGNTILQYITTKPSLDLVLLLLGHIDGSNVDNVKDKRRNSLKEIRKSSRFLLNKDEDFEDDFIESLQRATLSYNDDGSNNLEAWQIISGWIEKKRNKKWSTRFMVLEKDRIVYYKTINGPIQGTIMLDTCSIRVSGEERCIEIINNNNNNNSPTISSKSSFLCLPVSSMTSLKKKNVMLKFSNDKQMTVWLLMLKCINRSYLDNRNTDDIRIINILNRARFLNIKNNFDETSLHTLVKQKPSEDAYDFIVRQIELINWLIDSGLNVDSQDNEGSTPLIVALKTKNINAANALIKKGANIEILNKHFMSASNIIPGYVRDNLPFWSSIWNDNAPIATIQKVPAPYQIRGYTYLSIYVRKISYAGELKGSPSSSTAETSFDHETETNNNIQKSSKRLPIIVDDSADVDITNEAQLNIAVVNRAKNEIENNVNLTSQTILGDHRLDNCNAILFGSRWNMMTPLELIDDKTSVVFTVENDPYSSLFEEERSFKLDLALKTLRPGLRSLNDSNNIDSTTSLDIEIIISLGLP